MSHECEECGESFGTLSALRLHDCSPESPDAADSPGESPAGSAQPAESDPDPAAVEDEFPDLVGDLPDLLGDAREGDLPALYRAVAEYESVLEEAPRGDGPDAVDAYNEILFAYYEPLADGLDLAAQEAGWDVLRDFVDAYDPRSQEGLPEVAHVIANAVGRSLVRTRVSEGVESVPPESLAYLGAIPEYADEFDVVYEEAYTYGWGIGHPEHSVGDRLRELADTEHRWVNTTLDTAFYVDQHAAVEVLERLVTDESLTGTVERIGYEVDVKRVYFGAAADLERQFFGPHVPPYWDWEAEVDFAFELDPEVRERIRSLARETGVADDLPADWTLEDLEPGPLSDLTKELGERSDEWS